MPRDCTATYGYHSEWDGQSPRSAGIPYQLNGVMHTVPTSNGRKQGQAPPKEDPSARPSNERILRFLQEAKKLSEEAEGRKAHSGGKQGRGQTNVQDVGNPLRGSQSSWPRPVRQGLGMASFGSGGSPGGAPRDRGVGPRDPSGALPLAPMSETRLLKGPSGKPVATVTRHGDRRSYQKSSASSRVALAEGHTYTGSHLHEYEFQKDDGRHIRLTGQQLLGVVSTNTTGDALDATDNSEVGCILSGCIFPVNPKALGGLLSVYTELYEQNSFRHIRAVYVPQVPATEPGSLAMSFSPDLTQVDYYLGESNLLVESTKTFVSGPVWETLMLDISPSDTLKKYFNSETGDYEFSTQGLLRILNAGGMGVLANPPYRKIFGHLYLDFEVEFWAPALTPDIALNPEIVIRLEFTSTTAMGVSLPTIFTSATSSIPKFTVDSGGVPVQDLNKYLWVGTVSSTSASTGGVTYPAFRTQDYDATFGFYGGSGAYVRFVDYSTETYMYMFDTMTSAGDLVTDSTRSSAVEGQYVWAQTIAATNVLQFDVYLSLRGIPLNTLEV